MKALTSGFSIAAMLCLFLAGCATDKSKKEIGAEVGMIVGTVVGVGIAVATGSDDGIDEGMLIGAGAGAIIGGMAGSYFGEKLDELDQVKAEMAAMTALKADDERPVNWKSEQNEGVGGSVRVVSDAGAHTSDCKVVRHILNISGEEVIEEQEYCLDASGSWVLQS